MLGTIDVEHEVPIVIDVGRSPLERGPVRQLDVDVTSDGLAASPVVGEQLHEVTVEGPQALGQRHDECGEEPAAVDLGGSASAIGRLQQLPHVDAVRVRRAQGLVGVLLPRLLVTHVHAHPDEQQIPTIEALALDEDAGELAARRRGADSDQHPAGGRREQRDQIVGPLQHEPIHAERAERVVQGDTDRVWDERRSTRWRLDDEGERERRTDDARIIPAPPAAPAAGELSVGHEQEPAACATPHEVERLVLGRGDRAAVDELVDHPARLDSRPDPSVTQGAAPGPVHVVSPEGVSREDTRLPQPVREHDMTDGTAARLEELAHRQAEAARGGGEDAVARQHERGKLTARERIDLLVDEGSFVELDAFALHRSEGFGVEDHRIPGDGVITGHGTIHGRTVCVFSQDFTVLGGSLGEVHAAKMVKLMDLAVRMGVPIIGLNDSGGARIQEGVVSLGGYGDIFFRNARASGVVPQISAILGPCAGGAVYSPAMTDFVLMVRDTSHMFVTGPNVIRTVTGEEVTMEELGGAMTHATRSGVAHFTSEDEQSCLDDVKHLLSFLPSNNLEDAPLTVTDDDPMRLVPELDTFMPDESNIPYDVRDVIGAVVDDGEFLEVAAEHAQNIVIGFARLDARPVGVVANQPQHLAGVLDIDSATKAARFVRTCDAFNIPIVTFVDVPGFLPGTEQEFDGIIRHGAKLLYAYAEATVPKLTVILRKAYGGAYDVMGSKHIGADLNLAWPTAEIAVMGARGAVAILNRRDIDAASDPEALHAEFAERYARELANPWRAAERGYLDAVIAPSQTRAQLVKGLRFAATKREAPPARKHGNIPL